MVGTTLAEDVASAASASPVVSTTTSLVLETLKENPFVHFLLYQPPVGIVTLAVTYQWLSHRIFKTGNDSFLNILDDLPTFGMMMGKIAVPLHVLHL